MEKKSEFQTALEGFTLIAFGLFVIVFHVLKLVPESDAVLFSQITVFDLSTLLLKMTVAVLLWRYYKNIVHQVSDFYIHHLITYPETKSDLNFLIRLFNF